MRKVLLLIASLFLFTVFGWALHDDFYNRVVSEQAAQCGAEMSTIGLLPAALAGNNMVTDRQRAGVDTFSERAAEPARTDFYNNVLLDQVEGFQAENEANWASPTLLAGDNMVTGRQAGRGRDFYNGVLSANVRELQSENNSIGEAPTLLAGNNMVTSAQAGSGRGDFYNRELLVRVQELKSENNSIGAQPTLLAGNNMVTGEIVVFTPEATAPEDFYNQVLSAKVGEYGIDNNAIAPSNIEFAEPQSSGIVPGSMASNVGGSSESDWYSSTCAVQAELNRRLKKSQSPNVF